MARTGINNTGFLTLTLSLCCSGGPSTGVVPVTLKETKKQEDDEARLEEDF